MSNQIEKEGVSNSSFNNDNNNLNSGILKDGITFSKRVVREKPVYEYTIFKSGDPGDISILKAVEKAKEELENIIIARKIEDKVKEYKQEALNE